MIVVNEEEYYCIKLLWKRYTGESTLTNYSVRFDLILRIFENALIFLWMFISGVILLGLFRDFGFLNAFLFLSCHWILVIIIVFPLLFRTLRKFFEEVKEVFGINRGKEEVKIVPPIPEVSGSYESTRDKK